MNESFFSLFFSLNILYLTYCRQTVLPSCETVCPHHALTFSLSPDHRWFIRYSLTPTNTSVHFSHTQQPGNTQLSYPVTLLLVPPRPSPYHHPTHHAHWTPAEPRTAPTAKQFHISAPSTTPTILSPSHMLQFNKMFRSASQINSHFLLCFSIFLCFLAICHSA